MLLLCRQRRVNDEAGRLRQRIEPVGIARRLGQRTGGDVDVAVELVEIVRGRARKERRLQLRRAEQRVIGQRVELDAAVVPIVGTVAAGQCRRGALAQADDLGVARGVEERSGQRLRVAQLVAQFQQVAGVVGVAVVIVRESAGVEEVLPVNEARRQPVHGLRGDSQFTDGSGLAHRVVVLAVGPDRRRQLRIPTQGRFERRKVDRAAEAADLRSHVHGSTLEQVAREPAQVSGRSGCVERNAVERQRGLARVVAFERNRLRRIAIVAAGGHAHAGEFVERAGEIVRKPSLRRVLIDTGRRDDGRCFDADRSDDFQAARILNEGDRDADEPAVDDLERSST